MAHGFILLVFFIRMFKLQGNLRVMGLGVWALLPQEGGSV